VPFFESQYLTDSFYLYHILSVIVAQSLNFQFDGMQYKKVIRLSALKGREPMGFKSP
jgi:hypothetical protein